MGMAEVLARQGLHKLKSELEKLATHDEGDDELRLLGKADEEMYADKRRARGEAVAPAPLLKSAA